MYEAVFLNVFLQRFKKLPEDIKERIAKVTEELMENPYLGLKLRGELADFWKIRIGKYRLIYRINEEERKIIFCDVDLRKRVYG